MVVSFYHVKMHVPEKKSNKVSDYVRWWPQMDAYGIYKEFGEVMKTTKYSKLQDAEKKYDETDGQTEVDLKHRYSIYYRNTQCSLLFIISIFHYCVFDG